jgi:Na+-translocating ferredoxin:NAD+ oxidoreductase RnfG subunit
MILGIVVVLEKCQFGVVMGKSHWRLLFVRLVRLGLLVLAVVCLREAQGRRQALTDAGALAAERVRDFYPAAAAVRPMTSGAWHEVVDAEGQRLGTVSQTAPESDRVIGYSGSTNSLIARDAAGKILGLRVLRSGDTADHLAEVVAERSFFKQFRGKTAEELRGLVPDAVSGATLTSSAIAEGVLRRLGGEVGESLRFPEAITLAEVKTLEPKAVAMRAVAGRGDEVLDEQGQRIAWVIRTAPVTDTLVGYKGPSDTLMLLDASGETVRRIALRKSFDTKRYVGYVTGDAYFMGLFDGKGMNELAALDFKVAKIEGVSGATETSWAVAEGLKRRAEKWQQAGSALPAWWSEVRWRWQDTGHGLVILSALAMAFTRLRGQIWLRHGHHALLVIYGGFIAGEMLSQGLMTGWAGAGTPWRNAPGLVLLAAVALLGPVVTRKQLYCHHICPHGALQQLLAKRLPWQWSPSRKVDRLLSGVPFALLGFVLFVAMLAWRVDLNALEPFDAYLFKVAGGGVIALAIGGLVWALFTPLAYCRYGCPTGAVFKLLRITGEKDRLGWREAVAAGVILIAWGMSHAL